MQEEKNSRHEVLSTLEFEYKTSRNASTGLCSFEIDIGRIPHNMKTRKLEVCGVRCQSAADMVARMNAFRISAKDNLAEAQARQRHHADIKRRDVSYNKDDLVLLRNDNLSVFSRSNLSTKWQLKYLGPHLGNCGHGTRQLSSRDTSVDEKSPQCLSCVETQIIKRTTWTQGTLFSSIRCRCNCGERDQGFFEEKTRLKKDILSRTIYG